MEDKWWIKQHTKLIARCIPRSVVAERVLKNSHMTDCSHKRRG